jgi:hypothetical protein
MFHPDRLVRVGGNHVFKSLGSWPCGKCGCLCKPQMGRCPQPKCNGVPPQNFIDQQIELHNNRRLELSLAPGAAPYQPRGAHANANAITMREREELKRLRAQASAPGVLVGPGDPKAEGQHTTDRENALAPATKQHQHDPTSEIWRLATQDAQAKLDQARPPKLKATQLQLSRDLHSRENEVVRLKEAIKRKSDQYASIELQLLAHCEELEGKELEVVELRAKVAEAVVFTPPQAPTPATQAPAIRDSFLQRFTAAANDADVSVATKANLAAPLADQTRID